MGVPKLTRRKFVRDASVSTVATFVALDAAVTGSAAVGAYPNDLMTGVLTGMVGPRSATVSIRGQKPARVVVTPDAFIDQGFVSAVSGHEDVLDLTPFRVGEEIAIRGRWSGSVITATEFQSIYRGMSGEVLADSGEELQTSAGDLRLPARVREVLGIGRLSAGDQFSANVWVDPATGDAVAGILRVDRP